MKRKPDAVTFRRREHMAEVLKSARKSRGFSQSEVALAILVDIKTIQRLEGGAVSPNVDTINALADIYLLTLDEIFGNVSASSVGPAPTVDRFPSPEINSRASHSWTSNAASSATRCSAR